MATAATIMEALADPATVGIAATRRRNGLPPVWATGAVEWVARAFPYCVELVTAASAPGGL